LNKKKNKKLSAKQQGSKNKESDKEVRKSIRIVVIFTILITLAILFFSFSGIAFSNEDISYRITKYGLPSLFILSLVFDMIPQIISPIVTLSVAIAAGIKVYFAVPTVILGSLIGSIISFSVGKKYMFSAVKVLAKNSHAEKLTHLVNRYGKIIVPIAALSPLPYLPVVIGSMNMTRRNFIIFGLIPRAVSFIIYGLLAHFIIL
jgi:membrane protein YqaA with SNARE-associated domain